MYNLDGEAGVSSKGLLIPGEREVEISEVCVRIRTHESFRDESLLNFRPPVTVWLLISRNRCSGWFHNRASTREGRLRLSPKRTKSGFVWLGDTGLFPQSAGCSIGRKQVPNLAS